MVRLVKIKYKIFMCGFLKVEHSYQNCAAAKLKFSLFHENHNIFSVDLVLMRIPWFFFTVYNGVCPRNQSLFATKMVPCTGSLGS